MHAIAHKVEEKAMTVLIFSAWGQNINICEGSYWVCFTMATLPLTTFCGATILPGTKGHTCMFKNLARRRKKGNTFAWNHRVIPACLLDFTLGHSVSCLGYSGVNLRMSGG